MWWRAREHMLTASLTSEAMGGHANVYGFRQRCCTASTAARSAPTSRLPSRWWAITYSQAIALGLLSGCVGRVVLGAMGMPAQGLPTTQNMGQWLGRARASGPASGPWAAI